MSLFQRPLRPPAILSDQAVERYLEAVRAEVSVDPLFRRRLRGTIVNRFVAEREGRTAPTRPRRRMGKLGRAVLYASFVLGISVSSAMAASQGAAPGDALYPLKLQIETLRLQALPEHLHDELAAHALGERIHELGILAERGDWARAAAHAAAVEEEYRHFLLTTPADGPSDRYLVVLGALLERLPDRAAAAIEDVLDGVEAASDPGPPGHANGQDRGQGGQSGGQGGQGGASGGQGGQSGSGDAAATDAPSAEVTPRPTPRAQPDPTPRAQPDPTPRASKSPKPSPEATDAGD